MQFLLLTMATSYGFHSMEKLEGNLVLGLKSYLNMNSHSLQLLRIITFKIIIPYWTIILHTNLHGNCNVIYYILHNMCKFSDVNFWFASTSDQSYGVQYGGLGIWQLAQMKADSTINSHQVTNKICIRRLHRSYPAFSCLPNELRLSKICSLFNTHLL